MGQSMQTMRLRRYLQDYAISPRLSARVLKNAGYAISQKNMFLNEDDVESIALISEPLRIELHFEVNAPVLCQHSLFNHYSESVPAAMRKIAHNVAQLSLSDGDVIFSEGESPTVPQMLFVLQGEFKYWKG